jgi:hypothetical protein
MNENAYRVRAERGEIQLGTWVAMLTDSAEGVRQMIALGATIINYSSDAAVLRAGYASTVEEIRRALPAR